MSTGHRPSPLGKLPTPRSPAALDETILGYARQQAPQQSKHRQPGAQWRSGWITGMATAGIVAIAVFIADPQLQALRFEQRTPQVAETTSSAIQREVSIVSKKAYDRTPIEDHKAERARAQTVKSVIKAKPAPSVVPPEQQRTLADEGFAAGDIVSALQPSPNITAVRSDSAAAAPPLAALAVMRDEHPALKLTGERLHAEAETEARNERNAYSAATVAAQLRHCIAQLQAANKDGARACYQALRQRCPHCELPPSLQQAIAKLAEQAAAPTK